MCVADEARLENKGPLYEPDDPETAEYVMIGHVIALLLLVFNVAVTV